MALEDKTSDKPVVVVEAEDRRAPRADENKEREDLTLVPIDESLLIKVIKEILLALRTVGGGG